MPRTQLRPASMEAQAVYAAERKAEALWPEPQLSARKLRKLHEHITSWPEFRTCGKVLLTHRRTSGTSWGGVLHYRGANDTIIIKGYQVSLSIYHRTAWTLIHELAHVVHFARARTCTEARKFDHGADFRGIQLALLGKYSPSMQLALENEYRTAGLATTVPAGVDLSQEAATCES